ncbi:hydrogenase expression/formation protein HypD [Thermodesulfatator indicus DSM 15286]|uniref:Hydrogenase expression/formation protein HypD n=1 Tax=Thermodesulfatator indicus (strain DSM 15286 / JCM 11887 / CIR29812) TaxID=667014 RepID=F8ACZ5_THEID|nr:hydrogenase formation protein HypD [Thermodesulfatator indicus]AEH45861.1 hydrogenase expression/formation protein HypD [Thermodesulfatator indicus DSM 15286]
MTSLREIASRIEELLPRPVRLMEVCGTHTVNIFRYGLKSLFSEKLTLISGPGCPVCVTPQEEIDYLIAVARRDDVILATFGDMIRVPGSSGSLKEARARGANVKIIYSPLDAVKLAKENPSHKVVLAAVGFETTAPAVAIAVLEAYKEKLTNFLVAVSHRTMPEAMRALLGSGELALDGLILPGHVSTITGASYFEFVAKEFGLPAVVAGFEAQQIMRGIYLLAKQIAEGRAEVEIAYREAVTWEGNPMGKNLIRQVFEPCDVAWRGLGLIPQSGLRLKEKYAAFDAHKNLPVELPPAKEAPGCLCGEIICGRATPPECKLFAKVCTPETPKGPCMVSSEGTCAAWYAYGD